MGRQPHHIYPHWITAHCPFYLLTLFIAEMEPELE